MSRDVAIPHTDAIAATYLNIVLTDAFAYHRPTLERVPEQYTAPVRQRLEMGRLVSASDYRHALNMRDVLRRDVSAALAGHDALMLPTLPIPAPLIGAETRADRREERAGQTHHAQADAALQPDRSSRDRASGRHNQRRAAVLAPVGWCGHRVAAPRRTRVRTSNICLERPDERLITKARRARRTRSPCCTACSS